MNLKKKVGQNKKWNFIGASGKIELSEVVCHRDHN